MQWSEPVNGLAIGLDIYGRDLYDYAPGEAATLRGRVSNVSGAPLDIQWYGHPFYAYHATAFARLPDKRLLTFRHATREFRPYDARQIRQIPAGGWEPIIEVKLRFSSGVEGWRDAASGEMAKDVSFRAEGEYEFWVELSVPDNAVKAWTGKLTSAPVKINLREIPAEKRLMKPTPEQLAVLEAFYNDPMRSVPLETLLARTENEGLALHILDEAEKNPERRKALGALSRRVGSYVQPGVDGPYLKRLAEMDLAVLEGDQFDARQGGLSTPLLETYLKLHPEDKPLRERLITIARKSANLTIYPANDPDVSRGTPVPLAKGGPLRIGPAAAWGILVRLGVLHDGMTVEEATALLGPPTHTHEKGLGWYYNSQMHVNPSLSARLEGGKLFEFKVGRN